MGMHNLILNQKEMERKGEADEEEEENYLSAPPIASTISLQSFIGGGNGLGSRPRIKPKSTWKRRPSSLSRRLSRCLQPIKICLQKLHGENLWLILDANLEQFAKKKKAMCIGTI